MPPQNESIAWSAPTHEQKDRSVDWYWALGILGVCGAIAAVLWGNLLFAAIIAVAAGSVGALAARNPREHDVHIDSRGITIDHELYPYESLHSFWVSVDDRSEKLHLATNGVIHPHITLSIHAPANAERVYRYVSRHLQEEETYSLGSMFGEFFGL